MAAESWFDKAINIDSWPQAIVVVVVVLAVAWIIVTFIKES